MNKEKLAKYYEKLYEYYPWLSAPLIPIEYPKEPKPKKKPKNKHIKIYAKDGDALYGF